MSINQLALWDIQEPESHLIEVHYANGERRILDTANPADRDAFRDTSVTYAGFVAVENNATVCSIKRNTWGEV